MNCTRYSSSSLSLRAPCSPSLMTCSLSAQHSCSLDGFATSFDFFPGGRPYRKVDVDGFGGVRCKAFAAEHQCCRRLSGNGGVYFEAVCCYETFLPHVSPWVDEVTCLCQLVPCTSQIFAREVAFTAKVDEHFEAACCKVFAAECHCCRDEICFGAACGTRCCMSGPWAVEAASFN